VQTLAKAFFYRLPLIFIQMKKDIETRADIDDLMKHFYAQAMSDETIGYIFTDVAKIDLEKHLPHIVDFWEQTLFNTGGYRNNVLQIHLDLNAKEHLTEKHFEIWLNHFNSAADSHFKGPNTEKLKTRAVSIATVMKIKLHNT